jgi:hypothetical protein
VKALIEILKINPKDEIKETGPANDKSIKNIDKAREIGKSFSQSMLRLI